jgi:hypothetical protein
VDRWDTDEAAALVTPIPADEISSATTKKGRRARRISDI